jgi:hypothetical protein
MNKPRFLFLAGMILLAAASRLIPHPPNFSPIAALALFGGAQFADKRLAFLVPLAAMFLSDLVLGLHSLIPVIYGSFALIVCLGFWLRRRQNVWAIGGAAVVGALLFFVLTNFGVWAMGQMYPKTPAGLIDCYVAAIPFFQNTLLSNLFYAALLFGGLAIAENRFVKLREIPLTA